MMALWIHLGLTVLYVVGLVGLYLILRPRRQYPEPHPNVIVHTRDDRSIEGVQMLRDGWGILLGAAKLLNEGAEPDVSLSGDIRIPLANIRMIQEAR